MKHKRLELSLLIVMLVAIGMAMYCIFTDRFVLAAINSGLAVINALGLVRVSSFMNLYESNRLIIDSGTFWRCRHGHTKFVPCFCCGMRHPIDFIDHWVLWAES